MNKTISQLPPGSPDLNSVIAVDNATGTITEKLTLSQVVSLGSGAQGVQGLTGAQGVQGLTGSQGIQGIQGASGGGSGTYSAGSGTNSIQTVSGNNTASGDYSTVLGGQNNSTNYTNSHIIGSNITADADNTTFVNNLKTTGNINLGSGINPAVKSLTYGSTITINAEESDVYDLTLTGDVTLNNPTNPVNGKTIRIRILQDNNGNHTVTLGNKFKIPSSATNPLPWSASSNKMDILAATYHEGRDKWDVVAFVPGY